MSTVNIVHHHPELALSEDLLRRLIVYVARDEKQSIGDLNVVLSDRETVHEINREYLDHDYPTDVLAFDLRDNQQAPIEGEIYLDLDMARERCDEFDATFDEEAARYVIHGLLHLLGYLDESEEDSARMKKLEDQYLEAYWTPDE